MSFMVKSLININIVNLIVVCIENFYLSNTTIKTKLYFGGCPEVCEGSVIRSSLP